MDDQEYDNNFEITETEGLNFVSKATERPFGGWVNSSSEPVVKNKELDDWVPASEKTRVTTEVLQDAQGRVFFIVPEIVDTFAYIFLKFQSEKIISYMIWCCPKLDIFYFKGPNQKYKLVVLFVLTLSASLPSFRWITLKEILNPETLLLPC